jgi:hypothetical protein
MRAEGVRWVSRTSERRAGVRRRRRMRVMGKFIGLVYGACCSLLSKENTSQKRDMGHSAIQNRKSHPSMDGLSCRWLAHVVWSNHPLRTLCEATLDAVRLFPCGLAVARAAIACSRNCQALCSQLTNCDCDNSKSRVTVKQTRQAAARFRIKKGHRAAVPRIGETSAGRAAPF